MAKTDINIGEEPEKYLEYLSTRPPVLMGKKLLYKPISYDLPKEYSAPFLLQYSKWFGDCPAEDSNIPLPPECYLIGTNLTHLAYFDTKTKQFHVEGFACEWDRDRGDAYTFYSWRDHWNESLGQRYREPEYIENHAGTYSLNLHRLKRHAAKPGFDSYPSDLSKSFWQAMVLHWRARATPAQADLYDNIVLHHFTTDVRIALRDYSVYVKDPVGTCNYDGKGTMMTCYRQEEFKAKLKWFTG